MKESYSEIQQRIRPVINLWVKRIYVLLFNGYACYWLYREIFIRETSFWEHWEVYLLYFFTTVGMHFFVLDNQDVFIRTNSKKK